MRGYAYSGVGPYLVEERTVRDREAQGVEAHSQHHVVRRVVAVAPAAALEELHHGLPAEHHPAENNRGVNHREAPVQQQATLSIQNCKQFITSATVLIFAQREKKILPPVDALAQNMFLSGPLRFDGQTRKHGEFCCKRVFAISSFERAHLLKGKKQALEVVQIRMSVPRRRGLLLYFGRR